MIFCILHWQTSLKRVPDRINMDRTLNSSLKRTHERTVRLGVRLSERRLDSTFWKFSLKPRMLSSVILCNFY